MKELFTPTANRLLFTAYFLLLTVSCAFAQNIGVDVATPLQKLDVAGGIRIGNTSDNLAGSIRWNSPNFQGYNGSTWVDFNSVGGILSLNGLTGGTQTFAIGSAGTAPAYSSAGTVHTLNIPFASTSGVTGGLLSNTEYTSLLSNALPSGTTGQTLRHNGTNWTANSVLHNNGTNVGIGTTSPDYKLHISGSDFLSLKLAAANSPLLKFSGSYNSGNGAEIWQDNTGNLQLNLNSSINAIFMKSTGDVGIGISFPGSPAARLDVNNGSTTVPIFVARDNGAEVMRIADGGNVGIGSASPASKLDVAGTTKTTNFQMTASPTLDYVLRTDGSGNGSWVDPNTLVDGDNLGDHIATQNIQLNSNWLSNDGGNEGIRIDNNGNAGVGIIPGGSAYLDVTGTNSGTTSLQLRSGNTQATSTSNQIVMGYNGAEEYRHAIKTRHNSGGAPGNAIDFYIWKSGTDAIGTVGTQHVMTIDGGNAGSVGIGTTAPGAQLHTTGSVRFAGLTGATQTTALMTDGSGNLSTRALNPVAFNGLANHTAGTGLSGSDYNGSAAQTWAVAYGTSAGSAVQGNQTATINAGAGLTGGISADALGDGFSSILNIGAGTGIVVNADDIALATVGTAGTYRSVTTDLYGRVTAGTNPTTLAGYGITDAAPLSGGTNYIQNQTTADQAAGFRINGNGLFNGGNVGIGTTTPNQKLDIGANGGLGFSGTGLNSSDKKLYSPADGDLEWMTHNSAGVHGFAVSHQGAKAVYLNTSGSSYLNGGNVGIGTASPGYRLDLASGTFAFGNNNQRTETRNNAGLQGNAGAQSGMFENDGSTVTNYYSGASGWQHLIDVRHNNPANNYAMQLAGSFFDQDFYARKTNNNASQSWSRVVTSRDVAYTNNRSTFSQDNANSGYRVVGPITTSLDVKTGDVVIIKHTSKFRWTGGSGGDHPFYGVRISGACGNLNVTDAERIGTADDLPRGQWQVIATNYHWIATCSGTIQVQLLVDNNSDADDASEYRDIMIFAQRY